MAYRLSKSIVDSLPFPESGQSFYRDADLKGFGLRVGVDSKVYIAEGKINNRTVRVTIGKHGVFTAEEARNEARIILGQIAKGIHPNEVAREERLKQVTLEHAFEDFLAARKSLKPLTLRDYHRHMNTVFKDWRKRFLTDISKDMVARRHADLGQQSPSTANKAMRFLRSLLNFAIARYEDSKGVSILLANPVSRLSQTRAWYRVQRRQTVIKLQELGPWFRAVLDPKLSAGRQGEQVRDYLLLVILTGLRREEAAGLKWENIDLIARTLTVPDTKNHEDHTLPLSDFLAELLQKRKDEVEEGYVFASEGAKGYLVEPRKFMVKVTEASGVSFTLHDLRRTFITIAESLDIPAYALKRLLNHKMHNDVTAGYIISDVERLRAPMQRITDVMLRSLDLENSGELVTFDSLRTLTEPKLRLVSTT
jgi:integrase